MRTIFKLPKTRILTRDELTYRSKFSEISAKKRGYPIVPAPIHVCKNVGTFQKFVRKILSASEKGCDSEKFES